MREIDRRRYHLVAASKSHQRRVDDAKRILSDGAKIGKIVISMSWGKDSCALGDLACRVLGRVDMMHLASPYSLPGYDEVVSYFEKRSTVHIVGNHRSITDYIDWCKDIGLPHERTKTTQQRIVKEIKRDRGSEWCREHDYSVATMGLRAAEGGPRAKMLRAKGPLFQLVDGSWRCYPLANWHHDDVWAYLMFNEVPYNRKIYDAETHGMTRDTIRNAGWLSTDGAHRGRVIWLRAHFPEQYRRLVAEFPQIATIS